MLFLVIGLDREGAEDRRARQRIPHLEFIGPRQNHVRFGGPILTEDDRMIGSVMILDFPSREALDAHMAADPYFNSDLYEAVIVRRTRQIVPEQVPGTLAQEIERQRKANA